MCYVSTVVVLQRLNVSVLIDTVASIIAVSSAACCATVDNNFIYHYFLCITHSAHSRLSSAQTLYDLVSAAVSRYFYENAAVLSSYNSSLTPLFTLSLTLS